MVKFTTITVSFLLCLSSATAWSEPSSKATMTYAEGDPRSFEPIVDELISELEDGTHKIEMAMEETDDDDEKEKLAEVMRTAAECHKRAKKIKAPLKGLREDMEAAGDLASRRMLRDSSTVTHEFVREDTGSSIELLEEGTKELEAGEKQLLDELEETNDEKKKGPKIQRLGKMQDTLEPAKEALECVKALDKELAGL
eukprot:CAMPEP_0183293242 /NCGR_PEP_ID=MMETSP0160_2-20130417/2004_1 /TAXON_ID=2839 ORGANISM="Odontella Sinensis, Strain Grunow 1884" /NCGR_SAMPLE_ID=MMETSP0160_2 /ASSEMBLY_ACC=CAM_ASM_000250 /LENGTH=197 /DNA_ID=CAMNT_0025454329 /DNA_START=108 /DNA_END=701 /DNA_ORIENTATION=+